MSEKKTESRRNFLKGSTLAVAGATLAGSVNFTRMVHAQGSGMLKAVLIGCGGRGNGAIEDHLTADENVKVVAVADAFEDRAKGTAKRLTDGKFKSRIDIPDERVFVGLEAYKKAIDCGCDVVVTASPPGFRPLIYKAAIEAGKHVFMEKPCCVDAPGFKMLMEANKLADEKGLKVVVGLQRRHSNNYKETIKRIHDGALGKITLLRAYWNGGGIWNRPRQPDMTEMQYQVHNWYHFRWLSGDNIGEQHVHNLDVVNWVMDDHPVEANGMGGCTARYLGGNKGTGQIFDHHFVEFTYKDGTKMYSQCRHMADAWSDVSEAAHGTKGESNCSGYIKGENEWHFSGDNPNAMVQEHKDLIAAIRNGGKCNDGWYGATSSFTAVLGCEANYSGQVIKWDDLVAKGKSQFPEKLAWDAPAPFEKDANGDYPIATPGKYKSW
jgi:myo-inositol 2-dehydrogenase / D-chiro-inositol 1-dehydrogenase